MNKRIRVGIIVGLVALLISGTFSLWPREEAQATQSYSVAVLVVDDFLNVTLADVTASVQGETGFCAVHPEGAGFYTRGAAFYTRGAGFYTRGADGTATGSQLPAEAHGTLVARQLADLHTAYGEDYDIRLVPVGVVNYTLDAIVTSIRAAIQANPAQFYVLNFSFAILPCEDVLDLYFYQQSLQNSPDYADIGELQTALDAMMSEYWMPDVQAELDHKKGGFKKGRDNERHPEDMSTLLSDYAGLIVPVASAGNFGLDFPFYPAAWPGFVSVSGSQENTDFYSNTLWNTTDQRPLLGWELALTQETQPISNWGNIMMPGEWNDYVGTSFAAPRLSYAIALYLSQVGHNFCRTNTNQFGLAYGEWGNLSFSQAAALYCPAMLAYIPAQTPISGNLYTRLIETEDSPILRQGNWKKEKHAVASEGEYYLNDKGRTNGLALTLQFEGPYVQIFYLNNAFNARFAIEVDGVVLRTVFTSINPDQGIQRASEVINYLGDGPHTLRIYPIQGMIGIDAIYTTIRQP